LNKLHNSLPTLQQTKEEGEKERKIDERNKGKNIWTRRRLFFFLFFSGYIYSTKKRKGRVRKAWVMPLQDLHPCRVFLEIHQESQLSNLDYVPSSQKFV